MGSLWNRSGMVERYADDLRADGAKAFFFQGGTTTALTVFRDSGEGAAHPNPVVADANGRWPDVFVPYVNSFDVQVKSKDDVQITFSRLIPNPNPVDTTVIVPPENQVQTGMIHAEMLNTTKPGYVRLNGRTIGNASSSATERAHPTDTLPLFTYLWNNLNDNFATVSGGRGASPAADFNANKNITLLSWRGATPIGLDDMGNAAAGAFAGLAFNFGGPTSPGSLIGANSVTLSAAQMPAHAHTGTTSTDGAHTHPVSASSVTGVENQSINFNFSGTTIGSAATGYSLDHTHTYGFSTGVQNGAPGGGNLLTAGTSGTTSGASFGSGDHAHSFSGTTGTQNQNHNHNFSFSVTSGAASTLHSHTFTTSTVGGTTPINNIQLSVLVTWFIKL